MSMSTTIRSLTASALSLAIVGGVSPMTALGQVTTDSATWELQYNGDVDPAANTPAFTEIDADGALTSTPNSPSAGLLDMNVVNAPTSSQFGWRTASNLPGNVGTSMEWRIRLVSGNRATARNRGSSGSGFDHGLHVFSDNTVGCGAPGGCGQSRTAIPGGGLASDFHVYRVTRSSGGLWNAYVDAVPIWTDYTTGGAIGDGMIGLELLDVQSTGGNARMEVDYFRTTPSGAFVPIIPEPASLAMLSLGALSLLRRRR